MTEIAPTLTHPETAWLTAIVAPALVAAASLCIALLLRGRLALLLGEMQARRAARPLSTLPPALRPDPALVWAPPTIEPARLLLVCAASTAALGAALCLIAPAFLAVALSVPGSALLIWGLGRAAEQRYVAQLDRDLTAAVGRLSAMLRSGSGFRVALERLAADMPAGPLREEWAYLLDRQGAPLAGGGIATPQQVVAALATQTPSPRHGALLDHLSVAVGQPQDVLSRRCAAAYAALQSSDRRREEAFTELAQMRYSGVAVGLAGVVMATYLLWSQWERVVLAYSSPLGAAVGATVLIALLLPIAGGLLLARVEDIDY
jgi:hypothetical protein